MDFIIQKSLLEFGFFPFILPPILQKSLTDSSLANSFLSLTDRPFFKLFSHLPGPRLSSSLLLSFACPLIPLLLAN